MDHENASYPGGDKDPSAVETLFDDPEAELELEDLEAEPLDIGSDPERGCEDQAPPRDPADIILALNEENTELKNKALALLADMENLRRRTERELKDARQYAVANFARDMLSVSDNLNRALQAIPEDIRQSADDSLKTFLEGVQMTDRDLQNQLQKNGVQQLTPVGEKFDPNFHQAMFEVPDLEVPNGTVVEVVQAGYKIGDRVLRPAMVGISKGGPKIAPQSVEPKTELQPEQEPHADKTT